MLFEMEVPVKKKLIKLSIKFKKKMSKKHYKMVEIYASSTKNLKLCIHTENKISELLLRKDQPLRTCFALRYFGDRAKQTREFHQSSAPVTITKTRLPTLECDEFFAVRRFTCYLYAAWVGLKA